MKDTVRRLQRDRKCALRHIALAMSTALLTALFAACGGGSGEVSLGSGQSPDPVVLDFPIAYVKRPLPDPDMIEQPDARRLLVFDLGANLYLRERASPSAADRNVTGAILGELGDVRDVDVSYDGRRVVFAMRGPRLENVAADEQPTWNIWEYDLDAAALRRVIPSDTVAEEGHDRFPHYLPDGRIVFSSTRQRQSGAILLDEGKPRFAAQDENGIEPAFLLHVMNDDGSDLHQISFNQSHDRSATVLADGRIAFTRWDRAVTLNAMHFYAAAPDGRGLELYYGANSHLTGTEGSRIEFLGPRALADGSLLALIRPFTGTDGGGDLLVIEADDYVDDTQPTLVNAGLAGPAQRRVIAADVSTGEGPSPGGRYGAAYPLWDGTDRLLVTWSQCRLLEDTRIVPCTEERLADPAAVTAPPLYGLYIYDRRDNTQLPVVAPEEGFLLSDVVAASPRTLPQVILDGVAGVDLDAGLVADGVGVLHIRSVYDVDGIDTAPGGIVALRDPALTTAQERPVRFLRIEKPVSMADADVVEVPDSAFGPNRRLGMREILGYAPIEPDGSVRIRVPANVAFSISILDGNGRRIGPRHLSWLQLRPGEVRECNGCHDPGSGLSHGRDGLFASVNPGAPTTGEPFPNTDPALFADFGETMAETRSRISCNTDCAALLPSVDVVFDDVWTDETAAGRPRDASFAWPYADLATAPPTTLSCQQSWSSLCRTVIHYLLHVQPIWERDRRTLAADGITVLADQTCTSCHSAVDAAGNAQIPAGQLDLTAGPSPDQPEQVVSYRELLYPFSDVEPDPGAPPDPLAPPMIAGNARASSRFFSRFAAGGSHEGFLSGAELRLLSEWLDLGAQYYNDPFAVQVN